MYMSSPHVPDAGHRPVSQELDNVDQVAPPYSDSCHSSRAEPRLPVKNMAHATQSSLAHANNSACNNVSHLFI